MARILLLTQAYVPDPSTTGQHLHDAAAALAARGHTVRVLAANRGYDQPRQKYPRRETRDGVEIRRVPLASFGKSRLALRVAAVLSLAVQSVIAGLCSRKPDIILLSSHPPFGALAALVLSWLRRAPVCYWAMDLYPDQAVALGRLPAQALPARMLERLNRSLLARAGRVVTLDRFMAERVQRKVDVAAKTTLLPPWPHNSDGDPIPHARNAWRAEHVRRGRLVVMYSGNHTPVHPLDTLLEAALKLRHDEALEFLFVGGGLSKHEIDRAVARERPANIRSLPYQPFDTLPYSLAAADVHVVSVGDQSVGISHPCKIYGAMAASRPILLLGPSRCHATDIMGDHGIGWRVSHGDVDGLVSVLRGIRDTPRQRLDAMGLAARELVRRKYSRDALRNRFCDEVESLIGV